ncbi:unnamed protein product [Rotaria sp. Silwood1]|nr:unnamed protein product [Rotaria sp. Silwood1]CAF4826305.1 unnamed protein product [Rotaria sp. Silwood1]
MHQQLNNLRNEQRSKTNCSKNILRRGKKLPTSVLQQLEDNKNKFISMNGFLSTTKSNDVAKMFAGVETNRAGYQSVLFEMHIDGAINTKRPYADISRESAIPDEEEVLFFMGFVWRIEAVDKLFDNTWKVKLQLSTDINSNLTRSFNELSDKCTYFTLGRILHELGEYKNAISFYDRMLNITSELSERKTCADIHFHIAISAFEDGSYTQALDNLKKAELLIEELVQSGNGESVELRPILAEDVHLSPMCIMMNKGLVYRKKRDYKNAKHSFSEALKKQGSKNDKARVHYNLGVLQFELRIYDEARNNYLKALELAENQALTSDINQRLETLNQILSPNETMKKKL